ncbi:hypothetical protein PIROE2DRAFT_12025 [Piromyces sp. E2]|nr:hypothetical protein PIROE2DRAFT_12025 [Piromyces sp. E2]|eukprot:OUM61867.1 hypothetical protein PIROE2DRAFT_12025 [Piromyces sp. E2]
MTNKMYNPFVLMTTFHNVLLKNEKYSINDILNILSNEENYENENEFKEYLNELENLNYKEIISIQSKIINFLKFIQNNYKVGIDNIPVYNKMKISDSLSTNVVPKSNKRKLFKSKSESALKYKKSNTRKNDELSNKNYNNSIKSEIINPQEILKEYINNKTSQSLNDINMDDINNLKSENINNTLELLKEEKPYNYYHDNHENNSNLSAVKKENTIQNDIVEQNKHNNNEEIINSNKDTNNVQNKSESMIDINDENNDNYQDKNNDDNQNENNKYSNSNIVLKKENNNEIIYINLDGNNIECFSSNEILLNKNQNTSDNISEKINNNEETRIDTINNSTITYNNKKDIKYSNKYLKTKSSDVLPENSNNENVVIKITTVSLEEHCKIIENDTQITTDILSENNNCNKILIDNSLNNNNNKSKENNKLTNELEYNNETNMSIDKSLENESIIEHNNILSKENKNLKILNKIESFITGNEITNDVKSRYSETFSKQEDIISKLSSNDDIKYQSISTSESMSFSTNNENELSHNELESKISKSEDGDDQSFEESESYSSNNNDSHTSFGSKYKILNNEDKLSLEKSNSKLSINNSTYSHSEFDSKSSSFNTINSSRLDGGDHSDKESELSSLEWNISDISDETTNTSSKAQSIKSEDKVQELKILNNSSNSSTDTESNTDNSESNFSEMVAEKAFYSYKMGKIKNISIGFDNINSSDEIDVKKNIYTRDYWTDILLFIDILISSGNFKSDIQRLLRKLTLERNPSIYIIYSYCSEEDDEGNVTLYKKFIDSVNIFCKKVIEMNIENNDTITTKKDNIDNDLLSNSNHETNNDIDVINCDNDSNENDLDIIIPSENIINRHEIDKKDIVNSVHSFVSENIKMYSKESQVFDNNKDKIMNEDKKIMDINYDEDVKESINKIDTDIEKENDIHVNFKFENNNNDTIDLINCENEEINDFESIGQKEKQYKLTNAINTNKDNIIVDLESSIDADYIINENDFFEPSKILIDNIPSTLKLNNLKNKADLKESTKLSVKEKNDIQKDFKYNKIKDDDCYVKEITDESEEIVELLTSENKINNKKYKYLKK